MDEKVLNRVRGLLAKAESTEFPGEAAALREKAESLILTYGIEQALLTARGEIQDTVTQITINFEDPFSSRKSFLLHAVSQALGCQSVGFHGRGKSKTTYAVVVGYSRDLEQVELLYTSLLLQSSRALLTVEPGRSAAETRTRRSSFLLGFATRAGERLEAIYKRVAQEVDSTGTPGTALVLIDRAEAVKAKFDSLFTNTHSRSVRYRISDFEAGSDAADKADLGQDRFGAGRQKSLA